MVMYGTTNNSVKQPLLSGGESDEKKKKPKIPTTPFKSQDQGLLDTSEKIGSIAKETTDFWKNDGLKKVGTAFVDQLKQGPTTQHLIDTVKSLPNGGLNEQDRLQLKGKALYPNSKFLDAANVAGNLNNPFSPQKSIAPDITFKPQDHKRLLGTFNGREVHESGVNGLQIGAGAPIGKMSGNAHGVKDHGFVRSTAAQGMVQNLTTPQPQTGIPGVTAEPGAIPGAMPGGNWTGLMNAETAMLNAVVNPKLKPGQFQDFKGTIGMNPSQPGGDSAFRSIESQIADLTNQNKQLLGGYGQTTDMGRMSQGQRMAMVQKNSETIKALNDSLTGRSTLANDLVKALIGAQTNQQVANTAAGADIAKAGITGEATVRAADIEAGGKVGAARVTNSADVDAAAKQRGFKAVELRFKELSKKSEQGVLTAEENKEYQSLTETLKAYQLEGEDEDTPLPGMPKFS